MYQKLFQDFASLVLALVVSLNGFSPISTAQPEKIQAEEECTSQTGQVYPCDGSTVSTSSVDASTESIPNPGDQVHKVAVFHDGAVFAGQALVNILNTNPEIAASVVTSEFVEAGGLADFSCVVARLPGFGDTPTAATVQAIQDFVAGGGGYIGEWWGAGAALSNSAPSTNGDFGIPARFLSLFSGAASDGSFINFDHPITVVQDHPVVQGLTSTFSGASGTEFFVRAAPPVDTNLTVVATYEGHGGTNPAIMVGQSGDANAVLLFFDAIDEPGNANLSQLWMNSVNFACPLQEFQPPSNDHFADSEVIISLPSNQAIDLSFAGVEPDESSGCLISAERTVWYSFTPTESMTVSLLVYGAASNATVNVYQSNGPAISDLNLLGCAHWESGPLNFTLDADQTFYLQAVGTAGTIGFNIKQVFPPANDNFEDANAITTLPFSEAVDVTDATYEPNEPQACTFLQGTVWYSFTPTETVPVKVDALGGAIAGNVNIFLSTGPGIADLSFIGCANGSSSFNFYAEAGTTYYMQASPTFFGEFGSVQINVTQIFPPANDNFANAEEIGSLPFTATVDVTDATLESGEPQYCLGSSNTIWYSFTATANALFSADLRGSSSSDINLSIYEATGSEFGDLSIVNCTSNDQSTTFRVQAGKTYYLQVGSITPEGDDIHINLNEVPPAPNDNFSSATVIAGLPFSDSVDNTAATTEPGEPQHCSSIHTVWYSFTPTVDTSVRVDMLVDVENIVVETTSQHIDPD